MNRGLRAAIWIVAVVSIAIALYYPVTQYLDGKALDDEMLRLRQMKAAAEVGAPDADALPVQTDESLASVQLSDDHTDPGLDSSRVVVGETGVNEEPVEIHDETAGIAEKPGAAHTERMAEANDAASGVTDQTSEMEETAEKATDRMQEAIESMDEAAAEPEENVDESAQRTADTNETAPVTTGRMTEPDETVTDQVSVLDQAPAGTPGEAEIAGNSLKGAASLQANAGEKQTVVSHAASSQPDGTDSTTNIAEVADEGAAPPVLSEPTPAQAPAPSPTPFVFDESRVLPEYKALYEENRDLVGWLKIDGTWVDYPVLQRADEEYYLTRDFYGNNNTNGQIILDAQCDPYTPDVNLVISGHDMKSGKMFGTLQRYASERFAKQHPIIEFDTLFRRGRYRLVAAFETWDYLMREGGFRYNVDIRYRLEFKQYLEQLNQIKLYDTGVAVEFGDELITLSTCSTRTDDGRFVVVARRLREGEQA